MLDFVNALMDLLLYIFNSIAVDDLIISAPLLFIIFSMLVLIFRKLVGLH